MKKALLSLVLFMGVAAATPSFAIAAAPQAASPQYVGGVLTYVCPFGWTLVNQPQLVTYTVPTGRIITVPVYGPLGLRIIGYRQVQETTQVTQFVNANFCVPGVVVFQ